MIRRIQPKLLRSLLLALLLIAAQAMLLQHQADLAKHATNDHCEWCLTHGSLGGALPSAEWLAPVSPGVEAPAPVPVSVSASLTWAPYGARAPPRLFPV